MRRVALALALCACEKQSDPPQPAPTAPVIIVTKNEITYNGTVLSSETKTTTPGPPRIELGKQIGGAGMRPLSLSIERLLFVDKRATGDAIVEVDPRTGMGKDLAANAPLDHGTARVRHVDTALRLGPSPDGIRTAAFADGKLTVTYEGKTRDLALATDDAHACESSCAWVDNRLVEMRGRLVDTETMTLTRTGHDDVWYVPGTRTAIVATDRGLFLASVILP